MSKNEITIYGKDVAAPDLDFENYKKLIQGKGSAYAVLELFHENLFCELSKTPDDVKPLLVSARLFCENKNIRIRRLNDEIFRIAADFPIDTSRQPVWTNMLTLRETCIILWGYVNQGLKDYLYEEKIPYLFDYPEKALATKDRDRLSLLIHEYLDERGNILWSRFVRIEKWERHNGEKEEEAA